MQSKVVLDTAEQNWLAALRKHTTIGEGEEYVYFRIDPYTLGSRIPRVFQNLSDLHVRCHREKFYIEFLSQFFLGITIHVGESGKDFGAQSQ